MGVDLRWLSVVVVVSLIGGCGQASHSDGSKSRVRGQVLAGPTCPVERPGDTNCEPAPVQGTIKFTHDGDVVDSVKIDPIGDYSIEIRAGSYTLTIDIGDNIFPSCLPVDVEVLANVEMEVDVFCDTGIR